MINRFYTSLIALLAAILVLAGLSSCSKNTEGKLAEAELREDFLKLNTSKEELIKRYDSLAPQEQAALWHDKLQKALESPLPTQQKELLKTIDLIVEQVAQSSNKKLEDFTPDLEPLAIKLAGISSSSGFMSLFCTLYDIPIKAESFSYRRTRGGLLYNETLQKYIKEGFEELKTINKVTQRKIRHRNGKCNCGMTCHSITFSPESNCVITDCEETNSGCGFLWLFSCRKKNITTSNIDECRAMGGRPR